MNAMNTITSLKAHLTISAALNILATEYLVKTNQPEEYERLSRMVNRLNDYGLCRLYSKLTSPNKVINNLGDMITHQDYDSQVKELFLFLNEEHPKATPDTIEAIDSRSHIFKLLCMFVRDVYY